MDPTQAEFIDLKRLEVQSLPPGGTIVVDCHEWLVRHRFADEVLGGIVEAHREYYWLDRDRYGNDMDGQVSFHRLSLPYPANSPIFTWVLGRDRHLVEGVPGRLWMKGEKTWVSQSSVPATDRVYYFLEDVRQDFPSIRSPGDRACVFIFSTDPAFAVDHSPVPDIIPYARQMYELEAYPNVWKDYRQEMYYFKLVTC